MSPRTSPTRGEDNLQGTPLGFRDPEPSSEPVNGAQLLEELSSFIRRFAVVTRHAADAVAAWILATYAVEIHTIAAILLIRSPTKRCGKTRVLEILELLVSRPLSTVNASAAALFRTIELAAPTVLIDEAEVLAGKTDRAQELREILNAGYRRGPRVMRCVGDHHSVASFDVFGFKAIAAIGRLWDTVEDRSIHIELRRRREDEPIERFRRRNVEPEASVLCRKMARWTQDALPQLQGAEPELPDFLDDRAQDLWEPLLAIGAVAAGGWYERLLEAALVLSASRTEDHAEGIQLLADLRRVWSASEATRLPSAELLAQLHSMEDRPWAEVLKTAKRLAELLKPFGIQSRTWRFSLRVLHGYERSQFEDAFGRYLPNEPQQAQQSPVSVTISPSDKRNNGTGVADARPPDDPRPASTVADVAAPKLWDRLRLHHCPAWRVEGREPPSDTGDGGCG